MRFLHISDLHLGKRVNEFSMLDDQRYILNEILNIIDQEKPDGFLIAGDIYDKSVPSEDAVKLLNDFLLNLAERKLPTFLISGNHDSAVKLSFASELIDLSGIHFSPVYNGNVVPFTLKERELTVNIYLLPFLRPAVVRAVFPEEEINSYTDAVRVAIQHMEICPEAVNLLVAHQFVTGAARSDSEEISVGGLDNVDASVFDGFDYVALGHIHGPQKLLRDTLRYSGTPLKYSFSERNHHKSVTMIDISMKEGQKNIKVQTIPLIPKHDMRQIRGSYEEITNRKNYEGTPVEDYLQVVLTDEEDIPDAVNKLRIIYKNLMELKYDNKRTQRNQEFSEAVDSEKKSPEELVKDFYEAQNNQPLKKEQEALLKKLMEEIWKEA